MAHSVDAAKLGSLQSVARLVDVASGPLTVNHGLGRVPDKVVPVIRSVTAAASAVAQVPRVVAANASVVVVDVGADDVVLDVFCEVVHSLVR